MAEAELRLPRAVVGADELGFAGRELEVSGADFGREREAGAGSLDGGEDFGNDLRTSFETISRRLEAATDSEEFLGKKTMALLKSSSRSR